MKEFFAGMKQHVTSFLQWQWVKKFVYWIVVSAGTVAECIFLIASIWVSLNATVHPLMLKVLSEAQTFTFSELSISAFTALPEIILGLAVVTTYGQIKAYCLHGRNSSLTWSILFGLPTLVFAGLTIWTLCASALQIGYIMPAFLIATRVLAGYVYGFVTMLFVLIQEPDNADYVTGLKSDHSSEVATLNDKIVMLNNTIEESKVDFADAIEQFKCDFEVRLNEKDSALNELRMISKSQNEQVKQLTDKASSLVRHDLANYPKVVSELIETGKATIQIDEAVNLTGISKRRLNNANLKRHSRNRDLIMVNSLIEWLKTVPVSGSGVTSNGNGNGHVQDTDPFLLPVYSLESE